MLPYCQQHDLEKTKRLVYILLCCILHAVPGIFTLTTVKELMEALKQNEENRILWEPVKRYLPEELEVKDMTSFLSNPLLPFVILSNMEAKARQQLSALYDSKMCMCKNKKLDQLFTNETNAFLAPERMSIILPWYEVPMDPRVP